MRLIILLVLGVLLQACSLKNMVYLDEPAMVVKPIAINSGNEEVDKKYQAYVWIISGKFRECKFFCEQANERIGERMLFNNLIIINSDEGRIYPMTLFDEEYEPNRKYINKNSINILGLLDKGDPLTIILRDEEMSDKDFVYKLLNSSLIVKSK